MIKGVPKLDGVVVGEFTASFIGPTLNFEAKAAFINSKTSETYGWTTNKTWSPQTIAKLKELRVLMEMDLGAIHFDGGGDIVNDAPRPPSSFGNEGPSGIGEHVAGDGATQI
jgi:hypothetical protein